MNPLRYLLRSLAFSALTYGRPATRRISILTGRAIGGWLAVMLLGRRN